MSDALVVEGLHKSFGENEVLHGIDLSVAEHEVVCLIGASGSGKSTLLRCVNLLEPIDAGRIVVAAQDVTSNGVDVNRVRRGIGIVFQAFNLFPHMTVLRNVTLGPRKVLGLPRRAGRDARRWSCSTRFGLADKRDEYPDRLSGGQQQRVAIVRALAMQPRADAARRGDERARPGARRRGARGDPRARRGRHDDGDRHARDGLRARHREPRLLPRRRRDPRAGRRRSRSSPRRARSARGSSCSASSTRADSEFGATLPLCSTSRTSASTSASSRSTTSSSSSRRRARRRRAAGLIIPASAETPCRSGIVTAVGPDVNGIEPGDKVLYPRDAGYDIRMAGTAVRVIKREELIARVHD